MRERILRRVAALACDHPGAVLAAAGLVTILSVVVIVQRGKAGISTDLADVIPRESKEAALYTESVERFAADVLLVAVEAADPADVEAAQPFVERFARRLADIRIVEPELRRAADVLERLLGAPADAEARAARPGPEEIQTLRAQVERAAKRAQGDGNAEAGAAAAELLSLVDSAAASASGIDEPGRARALSLFEKAFKPGGVRMVTCKVGEEIRQFVQAMAEERGHLLLDAEDRARIAEKLQPSVIAEQMARNREQYESAPGASASDYFRKRIAPDPLDLLDVFQRRRLRVAAGQFTPKEGREFIVSPDGTIMLMLVYATKPVSDMVFDRLLMEAVRAAEREAWDELIAEDAASSEGPCVGDRAESWTALNGRVSVGYTGGYAIAVNENDTLTSDIGGTFAVSLLGVLALFAVVYRRPGALVYIGTPLVASILWTLAFAFVALGHISMMSGGFAAILVGLSIDYAVHVYNRYVTERAGGAGTDESIRNAIVHSGSGIFFGALTTAVAFFSIVLTRFVGLSEFGLLAGIGVVLGMAAMLLVLPAMLVLRNSLREEPARLVRVSGFGLSRLARAIERAPWTIFAVSTAVAVAAGVYSFAKLDKYFFDSDFSRLRSESKVFDLHERIQKKFDTTLGQVFVFSRGETSDEALVNAAEVARRAGAVRQGEAVAGSGVRYAADARLRPSIMVEGCVARIRRAEIPLPAGAPVPKLALGAEVVTQPDGSRLAVYRFELPSELNDWEIAGEGRFFHSIEIQDGSTARWRHEIAGNVEVAFSVWFLGEAKAVTLGLRGDLAVRAVAVPASYEPGSPWPPQQTDQIRLVLAADPGKGLTFFAGRGTIEGFESPAQFIPIRSEQAASAAFVASIDVDAVEEAVSAAALAQRFRPSAFGDFFRRLRGMVERAKSPKYLTMEELEQSKLGPLISSFYRRDPAAEGVRRHTIATRLFPEKGELPWEWYMRLRAAVAPAGELTAPRLVSYEARDMVHADLRWIMAIVIAGVAVSLVWSFRSLCWSLAAALPVLSGLGMLIAALLLIPHPFNYVNVLVLPVIVGIGIDNGIHVIHRFRQSGTVREIVTETGRALVMTSVTTMVGFGSLMISRYRGLVSLGFVATLGMLLCLYSSLVALPALLAGIERLRGRHVCLPADRHGRQAGRPADGEGAGS